MAKRVGSFFNLENNIFLCSQDVVFLESEFPFSIVAPHMPQPAMEFPYNFGELHCSSQSSPARCSPSSQPLQARGSPSVSRPSSNNGLSSSPSGHTRMLGHNRMLGRLLFSLIQPLKHFPVDPVVYLCCPTNHVCTDISFLGYCASLATCA